MSVSCGVSGNSGQSDRFFDVDSRSKALGDKYPSIERSLIHLQNVNHVLGAIVCGLRMVGTVFLANPLRLQIQGEPFRDGVVTGATFATLNASSLCLLISIQS